MPCVYYETEQEKADNANRVLEEKISERMKKHKKELDKATRVACKMLQLIEAKKIKIEDKELKQWAIKHKKQDAQRLKDKKG